MGIQLIFVVETNKKCKSDWIYIKDTIDTFYKYDNAHVKLSPLYMSGKKIRNCSIKTSPRWLVFLLPGRIIKVYWCFETSPSFALFFVLCCATD